MENKKLITIFGVGFSIVFAIMYYMLFTVLPDSTSKVQKVTLYWNQVGLYRQQDSIDAMKTSLEEKGFRVFPLKQGDVTALITSVSVQEEKTKAEQSTLKDAGFAYVLKQQEIEDPQTITLLQQQSYAAALERMNP